MSFPMFKSALCTWKKLRPTTTKDRVNYILIIRLLTVPQILPHNPQPHTHCTPATWVFFLFLEQEKKCAYLNTFALVASYTTFKLTLCDAV